MRLTTQQGASSIRFRNSSLDFTPKRGFTTTTKPMKRKETNTSQSTAPSTGQRNFPSRARGGSGPPPQSYNTLADLDGLGEADILKALYDNPHLAREAAQLVESKDSNKLDGKSSRGTTGTTGARSTTKKPRSTSRGSRDSPENLQQQNIPVFQWIVLVVLLGTVAYQLRKVILAPDKRGKKVRRKVTTPSNRNEKSPILDLKEQKINEVSVKKAKQLKPHKPVVPQAKARGKKPKSTVSISSSKASSKPDVSAETSSLSMDLAGLQAENITKWETVSKDKPLLPIHANTSGASKTALNVDPQAVLIEQSQKENMVPSPHDNHILSQTKTMKKKSKVTKDNAFTSANVTDPHFPIATDQDEALAKKLQEEEIMAATKLGHNHLGCGIAWEEVPPRHGRREKEATK